MIDTTGTVESPVTSPVTETTNADKSGIDSTIQQLAKASPKGKGKGKGSIPTKSVESKALVPFQPEQAAITGVAGAITLTLGQDTGRKSKKANADGTFSPILSKSYLTVVPSMKELARLNPDLTAPQLEQKFNDIGQAIKDKASGAIGSMLSSKSFIVKGFKAAKDKAGMASAVVSFKQIKVHDKVHDMMALTGKTEEECREFLGIPAESETSIDV